MRRWLLGMLMLCCAAPVRAADLRLAAPGDLQGMVRELASEFERLYPGVHVRSTFAPTDSLIAQTEADTAFDVIVAADTAGAGRLRATGLLRDGSPATLAYGRVALWARKPAAKYLARAGLVTLATPEVTRVAMPNPATSAYGRAAMRALDRTKLTSQVKPKLLYAEQDETAAEMAIATTQAALVSRGTAESPAMKRAGRVWVLPDSICRPIPHVAYAIANGDSVTSAFLGFLKLGPARDVYARHGLTPAPAR